MRGNEERGNTEKEQGDKGWRMRGDEDAGREAMQK